MKYLSLLFPFALAACASTGVTFQSGVGDRFMEEPPYYAGRPVVPDARIVVLPVHFQPGTSQPAAFDPSAAPGSAMATLVAETNAALDSVAESAGWVRTAITPQGTAPDVYFGCALDATNDCVARGDSVLGRRGTSMHLTLGRPSAEWIANLNRLFDQVGATHALLVTVELGQYWVRQSGLRGAKSVALGTEYSVELPWLTSLETPVSVLQLTAVLVDREGRGVRIGAEGIALRRTTLLASGIGLQRLFTDEDVELARSARRLDLPGEPVAWKVALGQLATRVSR